MQGKNLVGAATRYIAGRNAVQTVYWRGVNSASGNTPKFMKVFRTVHFAKPRNSPSAEPPAKVLEEQNIRF